METVLLMVCIGLVIAALVILTQRTPAPTPLADEYDAHDAWRTDRGPTGARAHVAPTRVIPAYATPVSRQHDELRAAYGLEVVATRRSVVRTRDHLAYTETTLTQRALGPQGDVVRWVGGR
ncbi:hypothetical protein E8D34_00155 [Nocardioides sp. GY 10113]|uniref:hypothetical protein n=1 Tax=Nocardioides sp. GY 10113 TaxID=2569761 RepID=UPI0010A7A63A|nr:hypothetical protein [Nocardioides sp. GY 10113]TIC88982.1 hypothetical protein E8D34_00155 [Nocardioides sp. GY 10113]